MCIVMLRFYTGDRINTNYIHIPHIKYATIVVTYDMMS